MNFKMFNLDNRVRNADLVGMIFKRLRTGIRADERWTLIERLGRLGGLFICLDNKVAIKTVRWMVGWIMDGGHDTPAYLYWRMQPLNETGVSIDHEMVPRIANTVC
jgi:hypothetical protein